MAAARSARLNPFTTGGFIRDPRLFFGRQAEVAAIRDLLRRRASVSVVGPRRSGKSSLLWYVKETITEIGWPAEAAHYLDMEGVLNWGEFFGRVGEMLGVRPNRREVTRALEDGDAPLLLCLDEFDRTANNPKKFPADFFAVLRGFVQGPRLRLLVATKEPLIDFSASGGMTSPFYNVFQPLPIVLGPLPENEARELLVRTAAAAHIELRADDVARAVKRADGDPWRLQVLGSLLCETGFDWPEAERGLDDALERERRAIRVTSARRTSEGLDAEPAADWRERAASVAMVLSVLIGLASVAAGFALGAWVAVGLGLLFLGLLFWQRLVPQLH